MGPATRLQLRLRQAAALAGFARARLRARRARDGAARSDFYVGLWREAATAIGAEFSVLGEGFCEARMGGRVTRMWQQQVMLDDPVTLLMAGNKPLSSELLAKAGLPTPRLRRFEISDLDPALAFLREVGRACVVKPSSGVGGGKGITTNLRSPQELVQAAAEASLFGTRLMIEEQVEGESYRLLYLDGTLLDAVCRRRPRLIGDGRSSVRELIASENRRRAGESGRSVLNPLRLDLDCRAALRAAGLSLASVPAAGTAVIIHGVSNDNAEADNISMLPAVGPELAREGALAARALGVRLAGVDVMTTDPGVSLATAKGAVLEVNTTPGLHFHYRVANPGGGVPVAIPILRCLLAAEPRAQTAGAERA